MSLPILGNQYFNQVENVASSQVQRVFTDNVVTTNLTVSYSYTYGALKYTTIAAYTPTLINGPVGSFTLYNMPGQSVLATAATGVTIPPFAILKEMYVVNTGVAIGAGGQLLTIGTGALNTAPGVVALAASGVISSAVINTILYEAGAISSGEAAPLVSNVAANNFLTLQVTVAPIAVAASIVVYLTYSQIV